MFTYQRERVETFLPEAQRMARAHYEFNGNPNYPLNPDWNLYLAGERAQKLFVWVARENGRAVGYLIAYASMAIHSRGQGAAMISPYYVEARPARAQILRKLISRAVEDLKRLGASQIKIDTDSKHPASRLLEALDFVPERIGYILKPWVSEEFVGHA